jgi:hypothetical protein
MRKKNNPLGNGEMYTGRQRNVQLYIYTNDGVWSAPVFFSQQKEITQLVETWRAISSDSYFKKYGWNAYEWNTKMTNWLGRASYNESFPGRRKETEQSEKRRIWGVDFKSLHFVQGSRECTCTVTHLVGAWQIVLSIHPLTRKLLLFVHTFWNLPEKESKL